MKRLRYVVIVVAMAGLPLWSAGAVSQDSPDLRDLVREYAADLRDVSAACDIPGAPLRFDQLQSLNHRWQARLKGTPFGPLPRPQQIDWLLMMNDLEAEQAALERERQQWNEMAPLLTFRDELYALETARLNGEPINSQTAATTVGRMAEQVKGLHARLEQGLKTNTVNSATTPSSTNTPLVVTAPLAQRAASAVEALRATLKNWYGFRNGYQPDFSWWVKPPYDEADKSLEQYAKLLKEEGAGLKGKDEDPIVGEPLGEEALAKALQHEFIAYDAATLLAIANQELDWCEREMKAAARDMGLTHDWKEALAKVKADFAAPGEQAALINTTAREAIAFTQSRNLLTIPKLCEDTWHLTMIPPETLKTIPYAAYNGRAMMVAYARDTMSQEDKLMTMRGNNRHFTRNVTPHELIPGHHLQRFQAERHNPHRAVFATAFYVEGWSMYWERRFWDLGWARSPEDRIGMLFWRMTRAARVVVTLQFHNGHMTPAEMVDMLVTRVGHERLGATAEVRRFLSHDFPPLYPAGYMLGGLQLEALRNEIVGRGLMTDQAFHDAVLAENAIPLELIRADLLQAPLTPGMKPSWRFADHPAAP